MNNDIFQNILNISSYRYPYKNFEFYEIKQYRLICTEWNNLCKKFLKIKINKKKINDDLKLIYDFKYKYNLFDVRSSLEIFESNIKRRNILLHKNYIFWNVLSR